MSTYTGSAFVTKYAAYLIYKGSATAAALNISQPKIGYVYDITEGGTLTPGNITVQHGDAVVYLAQGWTHCNNGGADQAIADLSSQLDELIEEIGETDFSKFALKTELPTVPTKVSAFTNDAGYLTQHQSLANYALKTEIPNVSNFAPYSAIPQNVSQLTNDAHYLTEAVLDDRVRKVADFDTDDKKTDGEIVQYIGETTNDYTNGYFYKYTVSIDDFTGTRVNVQPETSVASGDAFLTITNNELGVSIDISYNSSNQHLELKGKNSAVVSYVDMGVFIKDGMLDDAKLYTTAEQGVTVKVPYLKFIFNVASGKSVIRVSLKDLVDIYDGANINLTSAFVKAAQYSAPAIGDSMDVAIGKLLKGHEDNAAAIATKQDTLTFDSTPTAASNNPVTSGGIKAAIDAAVGNVPNALKQKDLTTYQGTDGEIVQHVGATTAEYVNGYVYKYTNIVIPSGSSYIDAREMTKYEGEIPLTVYLYQNTTNGKWWIYSNPSEAQKVSSFVYAYNDDYMHVGALVSTAAKIGTAFKQVVGVVTAVSDVGFTYEYDGESVTIPYSNRYGSSSYDERHLIDIFNPSTLLYLVNSGTILMSYDGGETFEMLTYNNSHFADIGYMSSVSSDIDLGSGWQRINVQPSSASDVAALETRMTAAETAIQGKQATITGAATTITSANLTASKILGSDANGKVAATSIATTDAEDAVSKRHTQNTDTQIVSGNNKVEVSASGTTVTGNGSVTGNLSVSGNLNVTGKETVEEIINIKSENNFITLRDGAQTAIASGSLSGTKVENYDGLGNDLLFGTDADGTFRIGDEGGTLEPIATRDEASNLVDGQVLVWDATNQRLVGKSVLPLENGGTGASVVRAARFNLMDSLAVDTNDFNDSTPIVARYSSPTSSNGALYTRTALKLWEYIKTKIFGSTLPTDQFILTYDATSGQIVGKSITELINGYVSQAAMTENAYWDLVAAGTVQADTLYITYDNDWEG